ncbi:MAG: DUF2339 domain-containing protein, partial [Bacteroidota bacterium]|nr:DUF2339 domain-containing protein [Bacteroidota bacterium]
ILNKAFITGIYSAIASYVLFILRNRELPVQNIFPEKIISKNVFRIAGIVILFLTGFLEINYQFTNRFPQFDMSVLYLELYSFLFVLLLLLVNNKIASIKMSIRTQVILLSGCLLIYFVCLGAITGLQGYLLTTQKFLGHFYAFWVIAILIAIIFYKLVKIEREANSILPGSESLVVWLICGGIVIFLSFEFFYLANRLFYSAANSLEAIQTVYIKTCLPVLWGICSFCFMWHGMRHKFKPLRIISLVLFRITLLKLFMFDISNIPAAGKIAAFFCLGVLLLIVSFMYQRLKKIIIQNEENKPA